MESRTSPGRYVVKFSFTAGDVLQIGQSGDAVINVHRLDLEKFGEEY